MILVTGATGNVGSQVVKNLRGTGARFRVAVTSPEKAEKTKAEGLEPVLFDYEKPETFAAALAGVGKLFLLSPANRPELESPAIDAAKRADVRHVVKLSVIRADAEAYHFGRGHREIEKKLEASGLAWTFLRPNGFMQNFLANAPQIKAEGKLYAPMGDAAASFIDVRDIGASAAKALTQDGHEGKVYELTGPEALTHAAIARRLSSAIGRDVTYVNLPDEAYRQALLGFGIPAPYADAIVDLYRWYRTGAGSFVSDAVERLTGKKPRSFDDFARDHAAAFR